MLQIHIAKEETKFGFDEEEVVEALQSEEFKKMTNIKIVGLMGMATNTTDEAQIRKEFKSLRTLFTELNSHYLSLTTLSMGMSSDYKLAIEEGSTMIRVGSSIFGDRSYN